MANIIDKTYFEYGDLFLPNITDPNAGNPEDATTSDLDFFITEYERVLLMNALGIVLYEQLQVALTSLPSASQKWKDLVDGITYTNPSGVVKRWEGLKGANKQSLVAAFIYTEYLRNKLDTLTTTGVVQNDAKNATNLSGVTKLVKAYNKFLNQYQDEQEVTPRISVNMFGTLGVDYFSSERATVSLYQFLTDSNDLDKTSFPDFTFKFYGNLNSLGI
tara:strand:- start:13182 stop:13835 length:654 start_codon:yes stop_codon:yes gene_type:complete